MEKIILKGELTQKKLEQILRNFYMNKKPYYDKYYDYFIGKQEITHKVYSDATKPCNRVVVNFCHQIVQQYLGFNIGIPVTYKVPDNILEILKYNDVTEKDNLFLRNALIFGKSFELQYNDTDGIDRFVGIDARYGIDIYSDELNTDELKYFIRIYCVDNTDIVENALNWRVEVYDKDNVYLYKSNYAFSSLELIDTYKHYFNQVPVSVFLLNEEEQSIFAQIISLQDSYNKLISSEVDDWEAFVDCYLILKNVSATQKDIEDMKTNRVLLIDGDSEASYLIKDVNSEQIDNMLENIKDLIFKMSNAPDFSDPNFMGNSGKALKYKLTGFNNISKAIMDRMEKALRKRIELIESINKIKSGEEDFSEITISFTQNIPADELELAQQVNMLRGLVSDKTLLSLLPFVSDVDKEYEELQKENQSKADLYNFTNITEEDGGEDAE